MTPTSPAPRDTLPAFEAPAAGLPPVVAFLDLDDNMFQTRRKCAEDVPLVAAAYAKDGSPLSFMTPAQLALFSWLGTGAAMLVPTTGRSVDAYRRVTLPFRGYAICSFGGVILTPDGTPEPRWDARVAAEAADSAGPLAGLAEATLALAAERRVDVRARVIVDQGHPLYLSVKHNGDDADALASLAPALRAFVPAAWRLHLNDNNLALFPPFLGKEDAVAWFLEHLAPAGAVSIGMGDSRTDAPFLGRCDYSLAPTRSQLGRCWHGLQAYGLAAE